MRNGLVSYMLFALLWTLAAQAEEVPGSITYQGYLTAAAEPLNGRKPVIVRLFVGEEQLCEESHTADNSITFVDGHFSVEIGGGACADLRGRFASTSNVSLELTINNERLLPHIPLRSVPYAMQSQHAEVAETLTAGLTGEDIQELQERLACIESCQPAGVCEGRSCFSGGQAGLCIRGACLRVCGRSWCPVLEGYTLNCNSQHHCEYTPEDPSGWRAHNVWIWVPPGRFQMGAPAGEEGSEDNERPVHEVIFAEGFFMAKYELTGVIYQACEAAGACTDLEQSGDNRPQAEINWDEAHAACAWLGGRLPSEAEWEYAASGPTHRIYPWGSAGANCELAVMLSRSGVNGCGQNQAWNLGIRITGTSYIGAMDMGGNVWEWVEDCNHRDYSDAPIDGGAWTRGCEEAHRMFRGGAFDNTAFNLRLARRKDIAPSTRDVTLGVRCLLRSP